MKSKRKGNPKLLEILTMILTDIKEKINIPDIRVFILLDDNDFLVIEVLLEIVNKHYMRHTFTKEMIYNDIDNFELGHFCKLCNFELNKIKEELRKSKE